MHFIIRATALLFLILFHTGCASIVSKSSYPVTFVSEPAGAQIEVKDQKGKTRFTGITPATTTLPSGDGYFTRARYTVTSTKDGYTPTTQQLHASMNGWYWGNLLFGGLIGMLIVDPISGAMYKINTPTVNLEMTPNLAIPASTSSPLKSDADVAHRLLKLKSLRDEGVLTEAEYKAKRKALLKDI
jgi:hypothetical protein